MPVCFVEINSRVSCLVPDFATNKCFNYQKQTHRIIIIKNYYIVTAVSVSPSNSDSESLLFLFDAFNFHIVLNKRLNAYIISVMQIITLFIHRDTYAILSYLYYSSTEPNAPSSALRCVHDVVYGFSLHNYYSRYIPFVLNSSLFVDSESSLFSSVCSLVLILYLLYKFCVR